MTKKTKDIFLPRNELEIQLLAAKKGQVSPRSFMAFLFGHDVYLLSSIPQEEPQLDTGKLLYLSDDMDPIRLAVFSDRNRARHWNEFFPAYDVVLKLKFSQVVEITETDCGIMLNPGQSAGMSIPPEGILDLKRELD
jgi:hypothetical protein